LAALEQIALQPRVVKRFTSSQPFRGVPFQQFQHDVFCIVIRSLPKDILLHSCIMGSLTDQCSDKSTQQIGMFLDVAEWQHGSPLAGST
jgi:hypothetical protein